MSSTALVLPTKLLAKHLQHRLCNQQRSSLGTTAYAGKPGDGLFGQEKLASWLPYQAEIGKKSVAQYNVIDKHSPMAASQLTPESSMLVQVDLIRPNEWQHAMKLMNYVIREGKSWPFDQEFATLDSFRSYFLSHTAFVVRKVSTRVDSVDKHEFTTGFNRTSGQTGTNIARTDPSNHQKAKSTVNTTDYSAPILGCFYIKPNFPGRCSHICNGGFITNPDHLSRGVGKLMGQVFIRAARDIGYKSAYFNLVFASNAVSVRLWESLGFERVAELKRAADLVGVPGLDTAYGYWYDLEKEPSDREAGLDERI